MTEQVPPGVSDETVDMPESDPSAGDGPTTTGVPEVDRVLADLDQLDDLPLEEHLASFEQAHSSLRAALDAQPGPSA